MLWPKQIAIGCTAMVILIFAVASGRIAWMAWQSSNTNLPEIVRGMPSEFAAGDRIFKRRIANRYLVGSSEHGMIKDLKRQGFRIELYQEPGYWTGIARISRPIFCGAKGWDVRWNARRGKITKIFGLYDADCL